MAGDEHGRAVGVEIVQDGRIETVYADRKVIVCGGAVNSPQILMLSGIGPADDLRALGLEVVLPDGSLWDGLKGLRKDNSGYDLKQLFIGSEGTLGVITRVSLSLPPAPQAKSVALLGVDSFASAVALVRTARAHLGDAVSALEFMDRTSIECVLAHARGRDPLGTATPFYVLVEAAGASEPAVAAAMDSLLEHAMDSPKLGVLDGTLAADGQQAAELWHLREACTEGIMGAGAVYKYDLSLPTAQMYDVVESVRERMAGVDGAVVVGYGHLGDANLHLNIAVPEYSSEVEHLLEPYVYEATAALAGSISAEHGLGQMKASVAHYSQSKTALAYMRAIKDVFDPQGILNPGKVLV